MAHNYFKNDDSANNEVDGIRAHCNTLDELNLWNYAQRAIIEATESQRIMMEKFPKLWVKFDKNVMTGK